MYEQIASDFIEGSDNPSSLNLSKIEEREVFVDNLLSNLLGQEKLKEKGVLADRLKFKRHQIEGSLKTVRKENDKKKGKIKPKHKKKIVITSKLKKSLNMYKLDKNEKIDFLQYEKMNEVWNTYASSCLLTCLSKNSQLENVSLDEENVLNCLKQIDYHGCFLTVTRSASKTQIGLSGIVLQDKRNVFFILCRDNSIKIIPKFGNLFEFEILGCKFTLVGSNICYRPEMRTTKHAKIKTKKNIK